MRLEASASGRAGRRIKEAVAAYRAALKERTRERVPLDWAATQMGLGTAFVTLGERERRTGRLEESVKAYRAALKELTQERVPLDWAASSLLSAIAFFARISRIPISRRTIRVPSIRIEGAAASTRPGLHMKCSQLL
jgi:hypothetical protein